MVWKVTQHFHVWQVKRRASIWNKKDRSFFTFNCDLRPERDPVNSEVRFIHLYYWLFGCFGIYSEVEAKLEFIYIQLRQSQQKRFSKEVLWGCTPKPVLTVNLNRQRLSADHFATDLQLHTESESEVFACHVWCGFSLKALCCPNSAAAATAALSPCRRPASEMQLKFAAELKCN